MRRTLAILCFIAGISLTPLPLHAQANDAAQTQFVDAFLNVRKGEEMEKAGDLKGALATYRGALATLNRIKQENPNWQAELLDFRIKRTSEAIARLQEKMGMAGKSGDNDLGLPPVKPLDQDDVLGTPQGNIPKARAPKGKVKQEPSANPVEEVQRQIEDLKSQLAEVKDTLAAEKEKNAKLTSEISEAMAAKKKAESDSKKQRDLAQVYEASIHELKAAGDANGARAKELEAKLSALNRSSVETQAELAAVEVRLEQAITRGQVQTTRARQAETQVGALPAQVKTLQEKLDAEQKATAQQGEQAKKREAELKAQIAALAKDKSDSAGAVAEMKSLQAKLDAEQKTSASDAMKAKKREEDLKLQLASLTKERNDARDELVRLREANKNTDKLMADNAGLLKKLGEMEKQVFEFKNTSGSRDKDLTALRKQITDTQNALVASDKKNAAMQIEITELQKKVTDYSKQISQFKADGKASAEERKKMEDENRLLQGIVTRVLQEDANRSQRKKMIQSEVSKLHLQSGALLEQISLLSQPVLKLSAAERKLFKKPVLEVQAVNELVAVKTVASQPPPDAAPPGESAVASKPAAETPEATPATKPPEPAPETKPAPEPAKADAPASAVKPKQGDDLPKKEEPAPKPPQDKKEEPATPDNSTAPAVKNITSSSGAKLPAEVKSVAEQAKKAFEGEKFADADKLYDKALQGAPNNVYLLSNRAVVQFRMGKFKQAEETFKKALAIAPEDAFCWSTIGVVYYQEEKFDEAVNALTKSLAINPRNPTAHNYLGITASQKGWMEAAEKELESATQLDPKYGDAWYNLAIILATKQPADKEGARKAYDKAIGLGVPKDPAMESLLSK